MTYDYLREKINDGNWLSKPVLGISNFVNTLFDSPLNYFSQLPPIQAIASDENLSFFTRGVGAIRLGKNDRVKTLKCKPSKEYKPYKRQKNLDNLRALWVKFPSCRYNSEA